MLSPWAFFYDQETRATENTVEVGALILVAEVVELSIFRGPRKSGSVMRGQRLAGGVALGPGRGNVAARWNFVVIGAAVLQYTGGTTGVAKGAGAWATATCSGTLKSWLRWASPRFKGAKRPCLCRCRFTTSSRSPCISASSTRSGCHNVLVLQPPAHP